MATGTLRGVSEHRAMKSFPNVTSCSWMDPLPLLPALIDSAANLEKKMSIGQAVTAEIRKSKQQALTNPLRDWPGSLNISTRSMLAIAEKVDKISGFKIRQSSSLKIAYLAVLICFIYCFNMHTCSHGSKDAAMPNGKQCVGAVL